MLGCLHQPRIVHQRVSRWHTDRSIPPRCDAIFLSLLPLVAATLDLGHAVAGGHPGDGGEGLPEIAHHVSRETLTTLMSMTARKVPAITAMVTTYCQIPPDLVVKTQAIDIVEVIS